jgi:hypothetical protein
MMMNDHHMSVPQMQEWDLRGICIEPLGNFFVIIGLFTVAIFGPFLTHF